MCFCIDEINKRLQSEYEDPKATLDIATWGGVLKRGVKIRIFYHKKHRNGQLSMKLEQRVIQPIYCPFCGDKLIKTTEECIQ